MTLSDWTALAAAVFAGISVVLVAWQLVRTWKATPPGGVSFNIDHGDGEATILFGALGSWVFYDVRLSAHGAVLVSEGQAYGEWPPASGVKQVDNQKSVVLRVLYKAEREPGSATVEITWVSGQDRSTRREGIRCNLETGTFEKWRRYRVQLGRSEPGRWVAYRRVAGF